MSTPSMGGGLKLACLQAAGVRGDIEANLATLESAAGDAAGNGADLLVTPEMFITGYDCGDISGFADEAEVLDNALADMARRHAIALLVGFPEPLGDGGIGNMAVLYSREGKRIAHRAKTHLYGDIDRSRFARGDEPTTIVDLNGVRIAILICFELEFPEPARAAALAGADLLIVPTANMHPYREINEHLVWTRAWENQIHVAYVNRCGEEGSTRYVGQTTIVGPDGTVLAQAAQAPALLYADISASSVEKAREEFSYLQERRPELYGSLNQSTVDITSTDNLKGENP